MADTLISMLWLRMRALVSMCLEDWLRFSLTLRFLGSGLLGSEAVVGTRALRLSFHEGLPADRLVLLVVDLGYHSREATLRGTARGWEILFSARLRRGRESRLLSLGVQIKTNLMSLLVFVLRLADRGHSPGWLSGGRWERLELTSCHSSACVLPLTSGLGSGNLEVRTLADWDNRALITIYRCQSGVQRRRIACLLASTVVLAT
mmetsp:Transcript_23701/g.29397  ORF Transcript_23701/g.29397 Transcript_23701/m.29397 type:complete len:205 (+) Transcript_23701:556-1170(+)